jgi:hypothetical protein
MAAENSPTKPTTIETLIGETAPILPEGRADEVDPEAQFAQMMAEKGGLVPAGFAMQVEQDFTGGGMGIARRLAMTFLEREFSEIVAKIKRDRAFALSTASMQRSIGDYLENYMLLTQWLEAAHIRMMFAVCSREDSSTIFAEADRERASALQ